MSTGEGAVASGNALAMRHTYSLTGISTHGLNGLKQEDEHLASIPPQSTPSFASLPHLFRFTGRLNNWCFALTGYNTKHATYAQNPMSASLDKPKWNHEINAFNRNNCTCLQTKVSLRVFPPDADRCKRMS